MNPILAVRHGPRIDRDGLCVGQWPCDTCVDPATPVDTDREGKR